MNELEPPPLRGRLFDWVWQNWLSNLYEWVNTTGTFTPTMQDVSASDSESQTYSAQDAQYHKIGNTVFFTINLTMTSMGTLSGAVRIAGLPYINGSQTQASFAVKTSGLNITAGERVIGFLQVDDDYIELWLSDATTGDTALQASECGANASFVLTGHYFIN